MKAALFTPYLNTLGGGERYMLSIAKALLEEKWQVDIESIDPNILEKAEERFNLGISGKAQVVKDIKRGDGYDVCFWLSDGSIPRLLARKNILHMQRPFYDVDGKSLINRMKFFRINEIIVNSFFTKEWIDREFPIESKVVYPPVDVKKFKSAKQKQKTIIYVGRFSQLEQSKRQDILVEAFIDGHREKYLEDYTLLLMGASDVGRTSYVDDLRIKAYSYPIKVVENAPFSDIVSELSKAKFFWSAAGFGVSDDHPEKREHFGMTVVESMASGCIPLVYDGGGHKEIIQDGENGILWNKKDSLVIQTRALISNTKKQKELSKAAKATSKQFTYEQFKESILSLL